MYAVRKYMRKKTGVTRLKSINICITELILIEISERLNDALLVLYRDVHQAVENVKL